MGNMCVRCLSYPVSYAKLYKGSVALPINLLWVLSCMRPEQTPDVAAALARLGHAVQTAR